MVELVAEGEYVACPNRSGGSFDPMGCRGVDVKRADDLVEAVETYQGRWLTVCLTVDRTHWIGPEAAYQRCNERVREVARVLSRHGVHATGFEVQGKNGDGWPHWHMIVWAPEESRTDDELEAVAQRAWRIRTEHVDHETGEVTVSKERIGRVDLQTAVSRRGITTYCAKYLVKAWEAVPPWMLEGNRQIRKLRLSVSIFDRLERLGLHRRHRGGRKRRPGTRRPARPLIDRMARSGTSWIVFQKRGGKLQFARTVPVPANDEGAVELVKHGAEPLRLGKWASCRMKLSEQALGSLSSCRRDLAELSDRAYAERKRELRTAWDLMQYERRRREEAET